MSDQYVVVDRSLTVPLANGRTQVEFSCPHCGAQVIAYAWSLAGSGKRCPGCPTIFYRRGAGSEVRAFGGTDE